MTTAQEPMDLAAIVENFNKITDHANAMSVNLKTITATMKYQDKIISIAIDAMVGIVDDDSVEFRIRRKLMFALQQIKGFSQQAQVEIKESL